MATTVYSRRFFGCILISALCSTIFAASCPCQNQTLCENIQTNYEKELYGFVGGSNTSANDTSFYNWTYLTTLCMRDTYVTEPGVDQVMCDAHQHGVRIAYWGHGPYPFTNDINVSMAWIKSTFQNVTDQYYDGYVFDYEGAMLWNSPQSAQYVELVNLTTQYFHENLPGSTISVCVPFSAYLEWGRQYDYYHLAQAADFLYIMDYDAQTEIFDGQCMARANSPYYTTVRGIQSYLNLQIDPNKLILGIPWYGKQFECLSNEMDGGITSKFCPIQPAATKDGVNCSDRLSPEISYAGIMYNVFINKWNVSEIRWDSTQKSPSVNMVRHNKTYQYWFDNAQSLALKYAYAKSKNLRGVGPFQFGDVVYDNNADEKSRAQEMWSAFDAFFV